MTWGVLSVYRPVNPTPLKLSWNESQWMALVAGGGEGAAVRRAGVTAQLPHRQGLTLVHFSAQPETFLTQNTS
jgi:hypothetical protein